LISAPAGPCATGGPVEPEIVAIPDLLLDETRSFLVHTKAVVDPAEFFAAELLRSAGSP
jgi:hypothetical protein